MWRIVALALVSLVVLAACSSDDEAEPATQGAPSTGGSTDAAAPGQPTATPLTAAQRATGFLGGQQTCSRFGGILTDIGAGNLAGGQRGGDTFVGETRWRIGQLGVDSLAAEPDIKKASNALFRATQQRFELKDLQEGFDELNRVCTENGYVTTTILGPNM
jgi:hypothetical protein